MDHKTTFLQVLNSYVTSCLHMNMSKKLVNSINSSQVCYLFTIHNNTILIASVKAFKMYLYMSQSLK